MGNCCLGSFEKLRKNPRTRYNHESGGGIEVETLLGDEPTRTEAVQEECDDSSSDDCCEIYEVERGHAIIINNCNFKKGKGAERKGSEVDTESMKTTFHKLRFAVQCKHDVTTSDMENILLEASNVNHDNKDCFVCVIMTHGEDGFVHCTDGKIPIESIFSSFKGDKCKSWVGKPKLFFIQACRGEKSDSGQQFDETDAIPLPARIAKTIPQEADFLMSYSSPPGYNSWRNPSKGSWYIQTLSEVLNQHSEKMDLLHMLTLVNKQVAYNFKSKTGNEKTNNMKQMPSFVSRLTKLVMLRPKRSNVHAS